MTNLTRVTGKVFGGEAPLNQIGQFGSAKTGTKLNTQDVATIQALPAYSQGWGSAIMTSRNFPPVEEVTGVLKTISYQNCYLLQEGVPTYDIGTNYSDTSVVKVVNGTNLSFYVSLQDDNLGHSLSDADWWVKASFGERNIGEVVTSAIPLTDAGLHLLDGSLLSGSGIYAAFISYIASIYNSSLDYFCTEAEWQQSVTTYGVCGKFVYDGVNNTVRLPKFSNKIYTNDISGNIPVVGNGISLGLTDGTKTYGIAGNSNHYIEPCTALYGTTVGTSRTAGSGTPSLGVTTDASNSGLIGKLANVTSSLEGYYYIVVATSTKTDIEVDIDEIATDLNGKADVDLSNINPTQTVKNTIIGWGMPDWSRAISKTAYTEYTATQRGWVNVYGTTNGHEIGLKINDNIVAANRAHGSEDSVSLACLCPVDAGDTYITFIATSGGGSGNIDVVQFIPCKGEA